MEPTGLFRSDSKRLNGLTPVPWSAGKSIIWNVIVVGTLAASYIQTTSKTVGDAGEIAVTRKEDRYAALSINYDLIVIAIETLGPLSTKTYTFLRKLGHRLTIATENPAKRLSYLNEYPLPSRDSMPFAFVTAFQFKLTLTRIFLPGVFYFCCRSLRNNNSIIIITMITICFLHSSLCLHMISSYLLSS